ncbi:flagellar basal body rod C-terminal domain-containing protein [Seleniivibrio sp.]|uniref:flagellar basal body rod C-terminal domain-containing protein n=1 Tax=Seleniivibrio sp. TaxID=2898801 RepID=UPI0025F9A918|nr:flagellar basal body rod C-terminal domain-containing protein [Seleniivibrio sp.]MCD8554811.1 flagellar basal body protein [Seleniivibrio sp.]
MIQGLYNSLNGMNTQVDALDRTANNVANINTPGYKTVETAAADENMDKVDIQWSGVDAGKEMTDMLVEKRAFQFNVAALKAQDEMLGTVIDLKG